MAGGNLDFLKGMALESAQLAVSYVKGKGGNTTDSSQTSNVTAVSDNNYVPILYYLIYLWLTCAELNLVGKCIMVYTKYSSTIHPQTIHPNVSPYFSY